MPAMFGPCLQPGGAELIWEDIRAIGILKPDLWNDLVLEVKDVQAENVTGKSGGEPIRSWKQHLPEDVLKEPEIDTFEGEDSILGWLLTHLPSELANQLRVNLPQIKERHAKMVKDGSMQVVELCGESSSQTVDGESQDDSWLAAHFLPGAANQPILGLSSPTSDKVDGSKTILVSEEALAAEYAAIPAPCPVLGDALPGSSPQFESSISSRQSHIQEGQGRAPSVSLSKKRLRDPETLCVPSKRRKASSRAEEEPSVASPRSSPSISQQEGGQRRKPSVNTSPSPSVYVSPKLERKARHLGFKGEAEIQNLAVMREQLIAMTPKPVEGGKPEPVPEKVDMSSSSWPKKVRHSPQDAEDDPGGSLKERVIQDIKDRRSAIQLRCIGSQSQAP
jgi:hypothetical protein